MAMAMGDTRGNGLWEECGINPRSRMVYNDKKCIIPHLSDYSSYQ